MLLGDSNIELLDIDSLVEELVKNKIKLWIDGESLRYKAPPGVMTKDLLTYIGGKKTEILEYLRYNSAEGLFQSPIEVVEKREYYPLSAAQMRMFLLNQIDTASTAYNLTQALKIDGKFNVNDLKQILQNIAMRQETLRTSFAIVDGIPMQKIHDYVDINIEIEQISQNEDISQKIKDYIRPFNLTVAPLYRFKIFRINPKEALLIHDMHHIIADGVTEALLIMELNALMSRKQLPALKIQYKDFVNWNAKLLASNLIKKQKRFWMDKFEKDIPLVDLPIDYTRPQNYTYNGSTVRIKVDNSIFNSISVLAREHRVTLFTLLFSAYTVLLSKYTGQDEIVAGTPVAGRRHADVSGLMGVFINTLPLRVTCNSGASFAELIKSFGEDILKAFDNQDYPFEYLVDDLKIQRDLSRNPIFDTMFILQNMDVRELEADGLKISRYEFDAGTAALDITYIATEVNGHINLDINYCTDLFKRTTIERLGTHFVNILKIVSKNPHVKLSDIDIMTETEKNELIKNNNDTAVDYPVNKMIHQLIEEQAMKTPDSTAIIADEQALTYAELNQRANCVAKEIRDKGVGRDSIVGILLSRSANMLIGLLGILKSGAAYLPIDPDYPEDRIYYMIENSKAQLLLTESMLKDRVSFAGESVLIDKIDYTDMDNLPLINKSNDLAYVIYTSGSTGKPKGVMLEHRTVINFIKGITQSIEFNENSTILCLTTISFDIFVLETILPLTQGSRIIIANEKQQTDPEQLSDLIIRHNVNRLQTTPSRMQMILSLERNHDSLKNIEYIMIGGEAFPALLLQSLKDITNARIVNMYGPTETTVWSAIKDLTETSHITIGKPIANTSIYIVSKDKKLQPIGVAGELCIGGHGLARGYLGREDLTSERFVNNPFATGEKMYRTGDLARWLENGEIEFLGRLDHQVKIRGYRIELEEIESQLLKIDEIDEAVLTVKKDAFENNILCAYYVSPKEIKTSHIRESLRKVLPDYMIPSRFIRLDKLPLTPNGKTDRKALPEPESYIDAANSYIAPTNEIEFKMVSIWEEVLGVKHIGIEDDFFELGGNSLLAIKLEVELEKNNLDVKAADVFRRRTIRELVSKVEDNNNPENQNVINNEETTKNELKEVNSEFGDYSDKIKVIEGIEPFNELYYRNCFYNSAFPILRLYNKSILTFLVNDVIIYHDINTRNCELINIDYKSAQPIESLLISEDLEVKTFVECKDINESIVNSIADRKPVIVWIDCFYESIRQDMFQKQHWAHTILIYGYDLEKQAFNIIEHKHRDNLSYEKRILSFEDMERSYKGFIENFNAEGVHSTFYEIGCKDTSIERNKNIDEYRDKFFKNAGIWGNDLLEQFSVLKRFIDTYSGIISNEEQLKIYCEELMLATNEIINAKQVEIYKLEQLFGINSEYYLLINNACEKWISIRNVLAKYQFSGIYRQESISETIKSLEDIYIKEYQYYIKTFG